MTNFPTTRDTFANPGAGTPMDAAGFEHDAQHANLNDAVLALETKVGITASPDAGSLDYQVAQLAALLLATDPNFKLALVGGTITGCLWDSGAAAYRPLTCVNGVLGTGDVIT